jgi:predicted TIM-barrel fold metal-dependent hydrolase
MIGDAVIVDAVVHPYDLSAENRDPAAQPQLDTVYEAHAIATDEAHAEYRLSREEFFTDFSFEAMAASLFFESPVDLAIIHALPNLGFTKSYVTDPRRVAAFRDQHPERLRMYATVDTPTTGAAIEQLEWQVRELGVDGLKLYPAFFYDGRGEGWRLDGEDFAVPLLEAAHDLGIRNVAIHKALWLPPAPKEAFQVGDVDAPLDRFGDMRFQIIHAGMAFAEETADLLRRHQNLYATLESMFMYILIRPDLFASILARLIAAAGSERLMFSSGTNLMHPRPIVEAFDGYELPAELLDEYGIPQLTDLDRRNILGLNALRIHGIDPDQVLERIAGDEFELARGDSYAPPWSVVREPEATQAVR